MPLRLGSIDTLATTNDPATYLPGDRVVKVVSFSAGDTDITLPGNDGLPYTGTEVFAGNLVCGAGFRSPRDPTFGTATSEGTFVDYVKGAYGLGSNAQLKLTRAAIADGSSVSLTFVGLVGQGGQYN